MILLTDHSRIKLKIKNRDMLKNLNFRIFKNVFLNNIVLKEEISFQQHGSAGKRGQGAKSDNLSSAPATHSTKRESTPNCSLASASTLWCTHIHKHT